MNTIFTAKTINELTMEQFEEIQYGILAMIKANGECKLTDKASNVLRISALAMVVTGLLTVEHDEEGNDTYKMA